jgi:transposase
MKTINRYHVGEIPLLESIVRRLNLRSIFNEFLPRKKNEEIAPSNVLILLVYNLAIGKIPLYELEDWVGSLDLRCIGFKDEIKDLRFTDDRFGKVLDRLFDIDRATFMTRIIIEAIKIFNIDLSQLHNDSTSVKAFGEYPGKTATGLELKKGNSKDHRPDLKQLVYTLTISADGAIPIHYKVYPGNTNDDSTHIETWDTLRKLTNNPNFLYVGDCKLCSDKQLSHISENLGRALCPMPEYWSEVVEFKDSLRKKNKPKKEIWRRQTQDGTRTDYFSAYDGECFTTKRGYRIHWIHYSERQEDDFNTREENLKKAERELRELAAKINKRKWKSEEVIRAECNRILNQRKVNRFINIMIDHTIEHTILKGKKGRPGKDTKHESIEKKIFVLSWTRNKEALKAEKNIDGVYPLLSTDPSLSSKEVLMAFKYQPKLEKRFMHLKSIHYIAPLFCKKLERVEANMFVFFLALLVQALIEREIRLKMKDAKIHSLQVYPENREAIHPTTSKVFDIFNRVSTYKILEDAKTLDKYADALSDVQKSILKLLSMNEADYWQGIPENLVDRC